MFFADEIVVVVVVVAVCSESRVQVEESLGRGLKLIRDKTDYI